MKKEQSSEPRANFGSKIGIIAAAAGSAIGLGNIWRFPYLTGQNGGAAFILVYFLFTLAIGIPLMMSELTIGRRAQKNPFGAFRSLKPGSGWFLIGILGIAAAFFILAFYSTIAGWTLEYLYQSISNNFEGKSPGQLKSSLDTFVLGGVKPIFWQLIFMTLTAFIVFKGVKDGIENSTKWMMPVLFIIIIIISIRSVTLPGASEGLKFLFNPDFSKINGNVILQALGQAFFSLSIGMGTMITYGSYISKKDNLATTAFSVTLADTLIAILAGVAIFPAVFAFGIEPGEGPSLVFITLPSIFEAMPGGYIFSILFFVLLAMAALTSTISILEVVVAFFSEELKISRTRATIIATLSITFMGVLCTLSQGPIPQISLFGKDLFDSFNSLTADYLLPLGGLLIVIFVGYFIGNKNLKDEISNGNTLKVWFYPLYLISIRILAPIAIALVFLNGLGILRL